MERMKENEYEVVRRAGRKGSSKKVLLSAARSFFLRYGPYGRSPRSDMDEEEAPRKDGAGHWLIFSFCPSLCSRPVEQLGYYDNYL
jgi:hypothetical protein